MRLDSRAIGNGLIRVHTVVELLVVEILAQELANLGDAGAATHHHHLLDIVLTHLRISQRLLNRLQAALEQALAQALELSTRDRRVEVLIVEDAVNLDRGLRGRREAALGLLACCAETTEAAR